MVTTVTAPPAVSVEDVTITAKILDDDPSFDYNCPDAFDATIIVDGVPVGDVSFPSEKYDDILGIPDWSMWASSEVREWIDASLAANRDALERNDVTVDVDVINDYMHVIWRAAIAALAEEEE